jgi:hypothetical protein
LLLCIWKIPVNYPLEMGDRSVNPSAKRIDGDILIPDLLHEFPQARSVLDRYGLRGCGGPQGPVESLAFFAKAHDVPIQRLLQEIRQSLHEPQASPSASAHSELADAIYRPFFKAGIAVALSLGAVWGAYLLLRIGLQGSFAAVGLHEVNAHGHAQIFGWVGLFVMGFAYQAFPRFKHTSLSHPRLAFASLWLMVTGIVGRSVLEPLAESSAWLSGSAVAASGIEVIAIGLFVGITVATFRASGKALQAYDYYILSALGWFVIQGIYETVYLAATLTATGPRLLSLVVTWQGALREMQIHGFALLMILGVSQRIFHHFYGFPAPSRRISIAALFALDAAVSGEIIGLVFMGAVGQGWAVLWYASVLLLTGAVGLLVSNWRIYGRAEESDRSLKFLRAAYVWLFVSLGMLVFLPIYQFDALPLWAPQSAAAQIGFSHAYYGAVRHAITVGFISLMIVGVAAKVVPTLNGVDVRGLSALWVPFVLINAGCALRVGSQTLTDFTSASFPFAGISGLLEVAGLAFWGIHVWSIMTARFPKPDVASSATPQAGRLRPGSPIASTSLVGDVLEQQPELLSVFLSFGFRPLANPLLRRALAGQITLEKACRLTGQDTRQLLEALNRERAQGPAGRYALTVLPQNGTTH